MRKYIASLVIISSFGILMTAVPAGHAATLDELHLSFQHDPKTTITVMWRTQGNLTPHVQYGTSATYGSCTVGTTSPAVADGFFYNTTELTGLTPDTAYH